MKHAENLCLVVFGFIFATGGCDPTLLEKCVSNEDCVDNYVCNKEEQCIEVDQKKLEVVTTNPSMGVVGDTFSHTITIRGGLKPYTVQKEIGPAWLELNKQYSDSEVWTLTGTPKEVISDEKIKITVRDNTIGQGQSEDEELKLTVVLCSSSVQDSVCFGHGTCKPDGSCVCDVGYAGAQCERCDTGFEKNEQDECVRYEYECTGSDCGSDARWRECGSEGCKDWNVTDCGADQVCLATDKSASCSTCGKGCLDGKCKGCETGLCCDNGQLKPKGVECAWKSEYKCSGDFCGAHGMEREVVQKCNGTTAGCDGEETTKPWTIKITCVEDDLCNLKDGIPVCNKCEYSCSNGKCIGCGNTSNGCCTSEGEVMDGCWYDPKMRLSWVDPPKYVLVRLYQAKDECGNLVQGGFSDWRLPNITELRSLIRGCTETQVKSTTDTGACEVLDPGCITTDCLDSADCDGCEANEGPGGRGHYCDQDLTVYLYARYWSSSLTPHYAWVVDFNFGRVEYHNTNQEFLVRCVRSGS